MKPGRVANIIRRIASAIENSTDPNVEFVIKDIKKLKLAVEGDEDEGPESEEEWEEPTELEVEMEAEPSKPEGWEHLEPKGLSEIIGDTEMMTPEEKFLSVNFDPKFKKFLREKLGLSSGKPLKYADILRVLIEEGLPEERAAHFAYLSMESAA